MEGIVFTKLAEWTKRNQLAMFFVIAFGYSWALKILLACFAPERSHEPAFYVPSIYGPTLSAFVLCLVSGGVGKLVDFLKQSLRCKVNVLWYVVALFGIAFLLLSVRGLHGLFFPSIPLDSIQLPRPALGILVGFLMSLPYGPLAEELGWRGFALPLLQKRMNALASSLVLGVIWWAWHLPQLLIPELQWAVGGMPPLAFLLTILPGAVLATWIVNNTRGSVLLTILFHGAMNYTVGLLGFNSPHFLPMMIAGLWIAAISVTLIFGPERLSRKQLDFIGHLDRDRNPVPQQTGG
jgi:membrane protease YdiL (CAAX protease family)